MYRWLVPGGLTSHANPKHDNLSTYEITGASSAPERLIMKTTTTLSTTTKLILAAAIGLTIVILYGLVPISAAQHRPNAGLCDGVGLYLCSDGQYIAN